MPASNSLPARPWCVVIVNRVLLSELSAKGKTTHLAGGAAGEAGFADAVVPDALFDQPMGGCFLMVSAVIVLTDRLQQQPPAPD